MDFKVGPRDLEEMLTYCVGFAKEMLGRAGEFYPFGAMLKRGETTYTAVGADLGTEHPNPKDLYRLLQDSFQKSFAQGEIVAAALAVNVDIPGQFSPPWADGIRVLLECEGYARMIYVPYALSKPGWVGRLMRARNTLKVGDYISVDVPPVLTRIGLGG